jgi:L-threonylcarbamoyladenylate synthase
VSAVEAAVAALRAGSLALIPTDTVYGLAADGRSQDAARALYAAKGRDAIQPTALLFASVDVLEDHVPELPARSRAIARALLPGPLTLVLPNPGRRFVWLNERRPDAIGVRVPVGLGDASDVLAALGVLVATSANLPGEPDPKRVEDVPAAIREAVSAVVDGGELPGTPSTVVDLTGAEPVVLRDGAVSVDEVLARLTDF